MTVLEEFVKWLESAQEEIDHVSDILSEDLSDQPEALIVNLQDAEGWNGRMVTLLAQANSRLDVAKKVLLPPKEGRTAFELAIILDASLAPIRLVRDTIEGYCGSIKQRLILGESILSYNKQFAERKARAGGGGWT